MRFLARCTVLLLACLAGWPGSSHADATRDRGRALTRLFFSSQLDSLHQAFNPQMAEMFDLKRLDIFRRQVEDQLGGETQLIEERTETTEGMTAYKRLANYAKYPGIIEVSWVLDANGQVAGFSVKPPQSVHPSRFDDYQTKTPLRLPVSGDWFVFWGGRLLKQNYHAAAPDQRFAYDLVVRKGDLTHDGDGKDNAQYYAFGQPIVAPGSGKVVEAVDGITDNTPGVMNRDQPFGNHVILDHGNGEFSFLAHFQAGSVAVKAGQKVKAGDRLGTCGNSGNSSEPHVHYHLQTTAQPFGGEGLPAQFLNYVADGKPVARGEPQQFETISQP